MPGDGEAIALSTQAKQAADVASSHAAVAALRSRLRRGRHGASSLEQDRQQSRALLAFANTARQVSVGIDAALESERAALSARRSGGHEVAMTHCVRGLRCLDRSAACAQLRARFLVLFSQCALAPAAGREPANDAEPACCDRAAAAAAALAEVLRLHDGRGTARNPGPPPHCSHGGHGATASRCSHAPSCGGGTCADHAHGVAQEQQEGAAAQRLHATALRLRAMAFQQLRLPLLRHAHTSHLLELADAAAEGASGDGSPGGGESAKALHAEAVADLARQQAVHTATAAAAVEERRRPRKGPGARYRIGAVYASMASARAAACEGLARSALAHYETAAAELDGRLRDRSPLATATRLVLVRALVECEFACATCWVQLLHPQRAKLQCDAAIAAAQDGVLAQVGEPEHAQAKAAVRALAERAIRLREQLELPQLSGRLKERVG